MLAYTNRACAAFETVQHHTRGQVSLPPTIYRRVWSPLSTPMSNASEKWPFSLTLCEFSQVSKKCLSSCRTFPKFQTGFSPPRRLNTTSATPGLDSGYDFLQKEGSWRGLEAWIRYLDFSLDSLHSLGNFTLIQCHSLSFQYFFTKIGWWIELE